MSKLHSRGLEGCPCWYKKNLNLYSLFSQNLCPIRQRARTQTDSVGGSLPVDPEVDPGDDDDEGAGHVDLDEEVAHVSLQLEVHLQRRVAA